jgi:hypothetical protein
MFIPLTEWSPDSDPTGSGVIVDVNNMIPSMKGYKGTPEPVSIGLEALTAAVRSASIITTLDGTNIMFAGTQTKIYKAGALTWTDVTRISGIYTGSATSKWRFAQQGNITLAVNRVDDCQKFNYASDTDFSDLSAMPISGVVEAVGQFILVGDYVNPVGDVNTPDGWACSAIGDYTDWTADVDTQCVYGRLLDTPGKITAIKRLGDYAIYYKRKSMYLARYVGTPTAWEFSLISDTVGAVSQESVVKVGQQHYFIGEDNFYMYDSAQIVPIGGQIKEWFLLNLNKKYIDNIQAVHDRNNGYIYWFYASGTSDTLNSYVAFHYRSGRWGKGDITIEAATEYIATNNTYAELQAAFVLYSSYDGFLYADFIASEGTPKPAIFDASHLLKTITGASTSSYLTPNISGADSEISLIRRIRPRYLNAPLTASLTNYYVDQIGVDFTTDKTTAEVSGKFDVMRSARWHKGKFEFTGDIEITGLDVEAKYAGRE